MTKAEIRKMESEAKYRFIEKTYAIVLDSILEQTEGVLRSLQIRIVYKNHNRYIHLHMHSKDVSILIFRDGNVDVELKEMCHGKHQERFFDYIMDTKQQELFWKELQETLAFLIPVFLNYDVFDFHTFMDYVTPTNKIADAYKKMRANHSRIEESK